MRQALTLLAVLATIAALGLAFRAVMFVTLEGIVRGDHCGAAPH